MEKGIIFSIEEFAIHDGPGIRTNVFLKGCPLRCVWCHNPEGISPYPQYFTKKDERTICGYEITSDDLANQLLKNKEIYKYDKGGVTLTGGEPLFQPMFVIDLLKKIRPEIHTAIETSGYANSDIFQKVISQLDYVLFDIKQTDTVLHKKYTGVGNELILKNLEILCSSDIDFVIRIPLIPGVNDTKENMLNILSRIEGAKFLKRVELLRYHKTAGAKYSMIGKQYNPPFDVNRKPAIYNVFESNHIKTIIL